MAKYSIIDATTGAVKYSGTPKYTGSYCKVSSLEFTEISSPTPINWKVGDYVVYNGTGRTGLTYRLYDIPQPKKRAKNALYGGAFVYSNVQFYPDTKWLDLEPFRDVVLADNDIHFSTRESWSVWASVSDLVERLQAVMNEARPNEWVFRLVNATSGSDLYNLLHNNYQDFTISGESVLGGLEKIYNQWGNIGWLHTYENVPNVGWRNVITLGIPPSRVSGIGTDASGNYIYGKGNGLLSLKKTLSNRDELRTRLFVYGSTRNMVPRYYNNLTPAIKDNDSVDIQHLMIPLEHWGTTSGQRDASKAYIENNTALYGVRPDTVYFDGSDDLPEIYPSLAETTIGNLYDEMASGSQYRPNLSKHDRSVRLDEIKAVRGITDDGQRSQSGARYSESVTIPVEASQGDFGRSFELPLFEGVEITESGAITIPLSKIGIVATTSSTLYYLNYHAEVKVAGRTYYTTVQHPQIGSSMTFQLPDIEIECSEGDEISATFVCVRDFDTDTPRPMHIAISATTLSAGISAQKASEFVVTIPQIGFDISTRARLGSQGLATISMRDGMCGGRSFVVKSCKYISSTDSWELTLYRGLDESLDILFPNTTYPIAQGDHYVLLDIAMPDTYIGMAERRLYEAGQELLADVSRIRPFYEPEIDAKFMTDNSRALREGWYMAIQDTDIIGSGLTEYVLIDTLVISEGESEIPTYKVTLREQKGKKYATTGVSSGYALTSLAGGTSVAEPSVGGLSAEMKEILEHLNSWFGQDADGNIYVKKDDSDQPRNFYAFGEITAGGVGTAPTPGGGGIDRIFFGTQKYQAEEGSTAINIPLTGTTGIKGVLGITALEEAIETAGKVDAVKINGVTKQPGADKIVDLGTGWATQDYVSDNYLASSLKGAASGLAELGSDGKVPSSQLPSYVDDVLEFASIDDFPATGESGKIYIAKDTNKTYRWSGTGYVEISASLALGETSSTAYRGDRGKIAYDHTSLTNNPHSVTWSQVKPTDGVALADLASGVQTSLGKADSAYQKPSTGIPTADIANGAVTLAKLEQAVQDILGYFTLEGEGTTASPYYLHTIYNLCSDNEITAGGVGTGGSGGTGALYNCADVTAYNNSKVGRSTTEGAQVGDLLAYDGTHWHAVVAPATGVTSFNSRTGAIVLTTADVEAVLNLTPIENAIKSLQSQVDSVASRNGFDELVATSLFADMLVGTNIYGALHGNADSATNADTLDGQHGSYYATAASVSTLQSYFTNGIANNADKLDGIHANGLFSALSSNGSTNLSVTIGGTTKTTALYATYDSASENISDKFGVVGQALQSLQVQVDSVASRRDYDELLASVLTADTIVGINIYGALHGNADSSTNADTVDNEHASAFAHIGAHNNLTASGNEFTFASSGFSGAIYLNYRTAGGTNGNITDYIFSNGKGGTLTNLSTLITKSNLGETAYNDLTTVSKALQSLQSQIDSIATKTDTSEINAVSVHADNLSAVDIWASGNILAYGEVTAGGSSDSRFKDNQTDLRDVDWVLKNLRPMEFDWNDLYHSLGGQNRGHDVGFIAQDIQPLIPSAIGKVYGDYLRLDYNKVTPYLVSGWQSHEKRIEYLERRVNELERQLHINS